MVSLIISAAIIFSFISINPNAKSRIVDLTKIQLKQTYLPYSSHHEEHYISALKMLNDKPIFGIGTNLFRLKCGHPKYAFKRIEGSCSTHPHNYYIQLLLSLN